jgi:DNA-binding NarL/FixJ family response regulator
MRQIRCLLAGTKPGVLADIVEQVMKNHLDVEMIERVEDQEEVLPLVRQYDFNVVIVDFSPSDIPEFCRKLLEEHPSMVIAGLVGDGKQLCILIDDPGPVELTEMIRVAVERRSN